MKAKYLFLAGLSAMMLGACSSDDVVDLGEPNKVEEGGDGYVSFRINLPQAQNVATRAENFDDGLASEYAVKDATLLLFAGNSEAEATFQSAYELKTAGFAGSDDTPNQITSKATITQKITRPAAEKGTNLYAMIVLNDNGLINITPDGTTFDGTTLANQKLEWFTNTISKNVLSAANLTGDGIFMTNAPLVASKQEGTINNENSPAGVTVQTLAPVDQTKIFQTAAEAGNSPAAVIYVERAVAKVTVTANSTSTTLNNPNVAGYDIKKWILDNTNKVTYLVRNMNGVSAWFGYKNEQATDDGYRFVGGSAVGQDVSGATWYRTYFAIDPNFNVDASSANLATIGGQTFDIEKEGFEVGSHGYCLENVFDVPHMKEKNTTRVIVAAQLTIKDQGEGTKDFYILNDNTGTIYTFDGVQNEVKRIALEWLDKNKGEYLKPTESGKEYVIDESNLAVAVPENPKGGYIQDEITITFNLPAGATWKINEETNKGPLENAMKKEVEGKLTIAYYKGGIAYYPVLVKHFGDAQTPWTYTQGMTESYPGTKEEPAKNWLGRYGVLRNNWYQINVTGVKNIGSPEVPTVTDRFDDPVESYMAVEINVLSWAVRQQDVEL